jgi:hypothetical protein
MEIERQQELGKEGLLEEDCYLAECNLGDLEETSGITNRDLLATSYTSRNPKGSKQAGGNTGSDRRSGPEYIS